jgi:hypothetical protein
MVLEVLSKYNLMTSSGFKKASYFTVEFLPSFGRKKEADAEFSIIPSVGNIPEEEGSGVERSGMASFSRAQSIPVTRSEHANMPSRQEIHTSLRSILRPRHLCCSDLKIEEKKVAPKDVKNFAKVLETTSESDDEDIQFGRVSSSERKQGNFSPPLFSRARTAPALLHPEGVSQVQDMSPGQRKQATVRADAQCDLENSSRKCDYKRVLE